MREIKFRQRNRNNEQWFYWGFVNGEWVNPKQQDNYDNPQDSDRFTGLPDKNGKEIYEGNENKVNKLVEGYNELKKNVSRLERRYEKLIIGFNELKKRIEKMEGDAVIKKKKEKEK